MDMPQMLTVIGANLAMMLAMLSTYVALYIHTDKKIEANRLETMEILRSIQAEMKDFHGRLCAIEEGRK